MIVIDRNAIRILELAWSFAFLAEIGHERESLAITREYLHSTIVAINDEQEISMMVEHQAERGLEQAISLAFFLGADRELDSSITIKSIVSHLFTLNPDLKHNITNKRCSVPRAKDTPETRERERDRDATMMQQAASNETTKARRNSNHQPTNTSLCLDHSINIITT